jgi:large subunit ribosomal protein L24
MRGVVGKRQTKVPEIRTGDTVIVLSGRDAGKRGTVERVYSDARGKLIGTRVDHRAVAPLTRATVVVGGINIAKRHTKPRQSQSATDRMPKVQQGGILDIAQPMPVSRVMIVCTHCDRPTRVAHATLDSGKRVRVCRHCGQPLEAKS